MMRVIIQETDRADEPVKHVRMIFQLCGYFSFNLYDPTYKLTENLMISLLFLDYFCKSRRPSFEVGVYALDNHLGWSWLQQLTDVVD